MESRQLRYFVTVARERNFTRAAEKLRIAQPPLSRQIQQLEDEVGFTLLDRTSRPIALTDAGKLLFEQAVHVIDRVDDMKTMMRRLRETSRARLAIGFVGSALYGYLPDVIRGYRAARPTVELTLLELTTVEQVAALKDGRIDIGFGRVLFDDPRVERMLLDNERLCAALPARHPLAARDGALRLEDFEGEALVVYPRTPRPSYADQVLALFRAHGLHPPIVHEVREVQTALGLVVAEAGVCLVPRSLERFRREGIAYRPVTGDDAVSPVIMSRRKGERSPEVALIVKLIGKMYRREAGSPHR